MAIFANLKGAQVGTYQLQAQTDSVASATSDVFQITAGIPAAIVASGGTPQSALILTAFGAPLEVTVTDASGNPVAGTPVVFVAPSSGASGSFTGQTTVTANTNAQGRASVGITANNIAGSYGVTASSAAITGGAMFTLTNLPPGSGSLAFVQQPGNTAIGQAIAAPPVTVQVRDSSGSPDTGRRNPRHDFSIRRHGSAVWHTRATHRFHRFGVLRRFTARPVRGEASARHLSGKESR